MNRAKVNAKATVRCQHSRRNSAPPRLARRQYSTEPDQNSGEKSKTKPLYQLSVRPNPLFMSSGQGQMGAHVGMLAGLRAMGVRIVFDQSAGKEDHGTTLSGLASETRML